MKTPDAAQLRRLAKRETAGVARRFVLVAALLEGQPLATVAREVGMDRGRARIWRDRFKVGGVDALREDRRRAGELTDEQLDKLEALALHGVQSDYRWYDCGSKSWRRSDTRVRLTSREIAARTGISQRRVVEALRDDIGLYYRSGRWHRLSAA